MQVELEKVSEIALQELRKVVSESKGRNFEVEEFEELGTGNFLVTIGYWSLEARPEHDSSDISVKVRLMEDKFKAALLNPWRRKYKRVEVDPAKGKVVAIRMYEPPLGVA